MHTSAPATEATHQSATTPAPLSRADRIHAIYQRNARRFRDVAFAAKLANDRLDQITPKHPDWRPLSAIQTRACAQMRHLSGRSIKLARAEIAILARGSHAR